MMAVPSTTFNMLIESNKTDQADIQKQCMGITNDLQLAIQMLIASLLLGSNRCCLLPDRCIFGNDTLLHRKCCVTVLPAVHAVTSPLTQECVVSCSVISTELSTVLTLLRRGFAESVCSAGRAVLTACLALERLCPLSELAS